MQSLMDVGSGTGINTAGGVEVVDSVKRKMPPDLRVVDRTSEICNSPTRKISATGSATYEVSSRSTLRKLHADVDIGEDGVKDVDSMLVEACFSRETTSPSSEICADAADEMQELSTSAKRSDRRKSPPNVDIQTAAEIEEFFSAAEKEDQNNFMDKYNFDVVKDVPLAGRYEWVRIKP